MFGGLEAIPIGNLAPIIRLLHRARAPRYFLTRSLPRHAGSISGQVMPETRAQFRALSRRKDLTTEAAPGDVCGAVGLAVRSTGILPAFDSLVRQSRRFWSRMRSTARLHRSTRRSTGIECGRKSRAQCATAFFPVCGKPCDRRRAASGAFQFCMISRGQSQRLHSLFAQAIGRGSSMLLGISAARGSALATDQRGFGPKRQTELRRIERGI